MVSVPIRFLSKKYASCFWALGWSVEKLFAMILKTTTVVVVAPSSSVLYILLVRESWLRRRRSCLLIVSYQYNDRVRSSSTLRAT